VLFIRVMNLSRQTDGMCGWESLYNDNYLSTLTRGIIDPDDWSTTINLS